MLAISCAAPGQGIGTLDIPTELSLGLSYLESYTYSCKKGYTTSDELCTVCQPDGSLSTPPPNCTGKINSKL